MPNVPLVSAGRRDGRARISLGLLAALLLGSSIAACGGDAAPVAGGEATGGTGGFDSGRALADVRAQVELGPRPAGSAANRRQTRWLADELRRAGVEAVRIQRPHRNVIGTIPGRSPGYVVVGAHHDTKRGVGPGFVGANDGASGVAVVLELARKLPRPLPGPSVAIALFDAEEARGDAPFSEDGTRGSRQYVADAARGAQGAPPLGRIRAMVLFDMVGDCDLQVPRESRSDEALYELFAEAAGGEPFEGVTAAIADDHVPFIEAGIPAVDLIDFSFGSTETPGPYWHTEEDTLDKVCAASLGAVGSAALEAIPRIR
jgi:glutaminyl-peptide cyclotransferase